jgi:hypothetical protein
VDAEQTELWISSGNAIKTGGKSMKKVALFMATALLFCITLSAQGTPGLAFTMISGGTAYEVSRGTASATHIEIPATHQGLPVRRIKEWGFHGNHDTHVTITIPNSVWSIGDNAFYYSGLTSIVIPNSVIVIGWGAFNECINLASVVFESPSSLEYIDSFAFYGCTSLTTITIPKSVQALGPNPFAHTPNLENIFVEDGSLYFASDGYSLFDFCRTTLFAGTKNSIIPSSVTTIRSWAFLGCSNLTSITIPNGVTTIGYEAFMECTSLTNVSIPQTVTAIRMDAFTFCTSLTSVSFEIPSSLASIDQYLFYGCSSLASITIPSSVLTIGWYAFAGCDTLTIYAEATNQPTGWHAGWNPHNRPVVWGWVSIGDIVEIPIEKSLYANYPNPFNPTTTIGFSLPSAEYVTIRIYNAKGQRIRRLSSGIYRAGEHKVVWDGTDDSGGNVSSGIYFYRMTAGDFTSQRQMLLLK